MVSLQWYLHPLSPHQLIKSTKLDPFDKTFWIRACTACCCKNEILIMLGLCICTGDTRDFSSMMIQIIILILIIIIIIIIIITNHLHSRLFSLHVLTKEKGKLCTG